MATDYSRSLLRIAVAQISQSLGWNAVQTTPMELLTDVMERYILEVGQHSHRYAQQFGRTTPCLDDLGLAFRDLGVNLSELEDYAQHVDPVPFAVPVPKFPVPRESMLHFPKPNSRELLEREEHIHEYLPPMHPDWDEEVIKPERPRSPGAIPVGGEEGGPGGVAQASGLLGEKRPAADAGEAAANKKIKNLPEEAGHSQYQVKKVWISSSGLPTGTHGILPDACTPPPPTPAPQTPRSVTVVPFPDFKDAEPSIPSSPVVPKPSVISETVEVRTSIGGVSADAVPSFRVENIDKMPQPKSPRGGKVIPPKSPKGTPRSPKVASKSPKTSPATPKKLVGRPPKSPKGVGSRSPKGATAKQLKGVKSPKVKKIKLPKVTKSPKVVGGTSPRVGRSPKKFKDLGDSGKVVKVAQFPRSPPISSPQFVEVKGKSPRKMGSAKLEELLIQRTAANEESIDSALPVTMRSPSPPGRVLDLSKQKFTVPTKAAMKEMPPSIKQEYTSTMVEGSVVHETVEAKESRLASYDDVIDSVVDDIKKEVIPAPVTEQYAAKPPIYTPEAQSPLTYSPSNQQSLDKRKVKSEKKQKKLKREPAIYDTTDNVVSGREQAKFQAPPAPIEQPSDVYNFDTDVTEVSVKQSTFPSPVSTPKSEKKKDKRDKKREKKALSIRISDKAASTPSGEESDTSRASRAQFRERSFSPTSPKVVLEQLTPKDIETFSYSPDKRPYSPEKRAYSPEKRSYSPDKRPTPSPSLKSISEEPEPIPPIKLDISQPKISIKIAKDPDLKYDSEGKKAKKKKKNKDRDREKSKEKKDKNRDKEHKKHKRDKEESTTVGGLGYPKLTLKFGGLKTATPTMSVTSQEQSPKQEPLKMVIKPFKTSSKKSKASASPSKPRTPSPAPPRLPSVSPPPSARYRSPSPAPSPSPSPSPSPLQSPAAQSASPFCSYARSRSPSPHHSPTPSRSRSHSPMPVLQHHSPLSVSQAITFSPLPSPAPLIELPPSRSPSPTRPWGESPRSRSRSRSPTKRSHWSDSPTKSDPEDKDDDEAEGDTSGTRAIIAETVGTIQDEDGQTIWICPACKVQDDGSPMIGCEGDGCDDWYHWVCIGIKKEPPKSKQWFCPRCTASGKNVKIEKRGRKPIKGKPGRKKTKNKK